MDTAQQPATLTLDEKARDFPELYYAADKGAKHYQRVHFNFLLTELLALSLAALTQILGHIFASNIVSLLHIHIGDIGIFDRQFKGQDLTLALAANIVPLFFLLLAASMFVLRFALHRDERWRGQRALAEATKGLAWRYSMRAMHEDLQATAPLSDDASRQAFKVEIGQLEQQGRDLHLATPGSNAVERTPKMDALRTAPLPTQRSAYLADRVNDQQGWYSRKSETYERLTNRLRLAQGAAYIIGILLIIFYQSGTNDLGVMTTIAGGFATWLVARHYDELSDSYGAMSRRLVGMRDGAPQVATGSLQTEWAAFVDEVETLLEGEHKDWLREVKQ